jgi:uncharacterized protein (DUF1778 family)
MAGIAKEKDHTLSMRLPKSDIAPIDRAANLRGRSRTDFVREAVRAAGEMLMENTFLRMSPRPRGTLPVRETRGKVTSLISQFMKVGGTGD